MKGVIKLIIFYNKKTRKITGTIDGRLHTPHIVENAMVSSSSTSQEDIGKYVVPFIPNIIDGERHGYKPDVPFADLVYKFERREERIYDYKVKLDNNKNVTGLEKKK